MKWLFLGFLIVVILVDAGVLKASNGSTDEHRTIIMYLCLLGYAVLDKLDAMIAERSKRDA